MKTRVLCARASVLSLALSAAFPAFAQSNPNAAGSAAGTLPEVVVTATRFEQPITDVVADMTVVGGDEIALKGATSMQQVLAGLPGIQVQNNLVYLRGAESRMTAVYIDGVRVDKQDGFSVGGGVDWDLIPVEQIERVEILRGAASAIYGADAMAGVIQIFTKRGVVGVHPFVGIGMGSHNTRKLSAGLSGAADGWDYAIAAARQQSDGIDTRPDLVHTPSTEGYNHNDASLRLGYAVNNLHRVELGFLKRATDSNSVQWGGGQDSNERSELATSSLAWKARWTDSYRSSLQLSHAVIANKDDQSNDYATTLNSVTFENQWAIASGLLTAVLEQKKDAFDTQASPYGAPAFAENRTQKGLGLGYSVSVGAHALQWSLRNDVDSNFGAFGTGALSYAYKMSPQWKATASAGTAFRAPTLEQTYGPYGSTELKPEKSESSEVSIGYSDSVTAFKVLAYRNRFQDLISSSQALNTCAAGEFCWYNVGRATVEGTTLSAAHTMGRFSVRASSDWLNPVNDITGNALSLRARRMNALGASMQAQSWTLGADVVDVGQRFNNAANTVVLPSYTLLNLYANLPLSAEWTWNFRVDNATDQSYVLHDTYANPRATFFTEIRWTPKL